MGTAIFEFNNLTRMEGKVVVLPDNWLLLDLQSEKGEVLSQVVFPVGVKATNKKRLRKWIEEQITRAALAQTCYYCKAAFQNRAANSERLYMWCTHCGFSCFNWKI